MSGLGIQSIIPRIRPPVVVPVFWCVTCQMSLRNEDERVAHLKVLPSHVVKTVRRLTCPRCGNDIPLESGRFPVHWVGSGSDLHVCRGSNGRV